MGLTWASELEALLPGSFSGPSEVFQNLNVSNEVRILVGCTESLYMIGCKT